MVEITFRVLNRCVEIPLLLFFFSVMVYAPVSTNFIIYRTCYVTLGYSQSDCEKLGTGNEDNGTKELEKLVQPRANVINMAQSLVTQIVPAFLCLFVGAWSDKYGRKPVLISTTTGFTLSSIMGLVVVLIPTLSPWYLLVACIPAVLFGGFSPMLMATLCYVTDITTDENRGMRFGIFESVIALGMLLGTISSSYIFSLGGYVAVYSVALACHLLMWLYMIFVLSETVLHTGDNQSDTSIFAFKNIFDIFRTTFKARESFERSVLLITIGMATVFVLATTADWSIFYMFLREKLNWDLQQYTLYKSVSSAIGIIGTFIGLSVLHKLLEIPETPLMLIGFLTYLPSVLLQGFASKDWHIYLAGGLRCICGIVSPMCRSLMSKIVPQEEVGRVFSLVLTMDAVISLIGSPMYTIIYNNTLDTNPGAFNFVTAGILGVEIVLVVIVIIMQRTVLTSNPYTSLPINVET